MTRTTLWIGALVLAGGGLLAWGMTGGGAAADATTITVYKSPTCGCCEAWIEHMEGAGFRVKVENQTGGGLAAVKAEHGVYAALASCHTAVVDGYVVEGHVPADLVQDMLRERPPVAGLAVPGMPARAPGMDSPTGPEYEVLVFRDDGSTEVRARR